MERLTFGPPPELLAGDSIEPPSLSARAGGVLGGLPGVPGGGVLVAGGLELGAPLVSVS